MNEEDKSNSQSIDIERFWRDEEYRSTLTAEQLAKLPPNPANDFELSETELDQTTGGIENSTPQRYNFIRGWPRKTAGPSLNN